MPLSLHTISPKKSSRQTKKRIGRGWASKGKYSGRGMKGQRSRSGGKAGLKKLGMRKIMLATPKNKGFKSGRPKLDVVNVAEINKVFAAGAKVTPKLLLSKGLVSKITNGVKVLGNGSIAISITITDCKVSETAKTKIEQAGGTVVSK